MKTYSFDDIVIGLGAMGSAATYHLARRGRRVLGLDMYASGHDQGSSHGHHRMIRMSSYRDDGYIGLAARAFELWDELEQASGKDILKLTGEVSLYDPDHDPYHRPRIGDDFRFRERFTTEEFQKRFPGFRLYGNMTATYEEKAGFLRPEVGIAAHLELAKRHGAALHHNEEVSSWQIDGQGVRVDSDKATYTANRLIVTTGPWAAELLADLHLPLTVVRIVNGYFEPTRPDLWAAENGATTFLLSVAEGSYYGMPAVDGVGLKIGRHDNGIPTTARTIDRDIDADEIEMLRNTLDRYMPGASGPVSMKITCMYTNTPDSEFIVERHPLHRQVVYGCGFSGRGYKFSPTVGEILADLAIDGQTKHDIDFLSSRRFD